MTSPRATVTVPQSQYAYSFWKKCLLRGCYRAVAECSCQTSVARGCKAGHPERSRPVSGLLLEAQVISFSPNYSPYDSLGPWPDSVDRTNPHTTVHRNASPIASHFPKILTSARRRCTLYSKSLDIQIQELKSFSCMGLRTSLFDQFCVRLQPEI